MTSKELEKLFQVYQAASKNISGDESAYDFKSRDAEACFLDFERTGVLVETIDLAIKKIQLEKIDILEAGSGTGIIAILAAKANPNCHITCLEINAITAAKSMAFIEALGMEKQIELINCDILKTHNSELKTYNIIFSETLSGGLFFEPQLEIMQYLRRFLKPSAILIPEAIQLYIHLEDPQLLEPMTEAIEYANINFQTFEGKEINAEIVLPILKSGKANIAVITSKLKLNEEITVKTDSKYKNFLNRAIINIPENQQKELEATKKAKMHISYQAGQTVDKCKLTFSS